MSDAAFGIASALAAIAALVVLAWFAEAPRRRAAALRELRLPPSVGAAVARRYPHLSLGQREFALEALRDWFHCCAAAKLRPMAMPSQVVDEAWHAFILDTREYEAFCRAAFGRFLHHVPAEAMPSPTSAPEPLQRTWAFACRRERLDPKLPRALPRLFAADAALAIPDGFHYVLDCVGGVPDASLPPGVTRFCAVHIGTPPQWRAGCSAAGCGGHACGSGASGCGGGCGGGGD